MTAPSERPVVAVVTPVYNGEAWIADSMTSVLEQDAVRAGRVRLRYVVMDGGSTDATLDIVRGLATGDVDVHSGPDSGMYDALSRGLAEVAPGSDVCAYLNAGDLWTPTALDVVTAALAEPGISWVCGYRTAYNRAGQVVHVSLPYRYRSSLLACAAYGTTLPAVQQESTFWRSELLRHVDLDELASFTLAGDFYLWRSFSQVTDLHCIRSVLGGFRVHGGHLSDDRGRYRTEMMRVAAPPDVRQRLLTGIDKVVWNGPDWLKRRCAGAQMTSYDFGTDSWVRGGASLRALRTGAGRAPATAAARSDPAAPAVAARTR